MTNKDTSRDAEITRKLGIAPSCGNCAHRWDALLGRCRAFPEGIPRVIWNGYVSHLENVEGDGGITWSPNDALEPHVDRVRRTPKEQALIDSLGVEE